MKQKRTRDVKWEKSSKPDTLRELRCSKCNTDTFYVRHVPPGRSGGRNQSRVLAFCPGCNDYKRIRLGTPMTAEAKPRKKK